MGPWRTFWALSVLFLAWMPARVGGEDLPPTEYANRVTEYFSADCSESRRGVIIELFRHDVPRANLRKDLARYVTRPECRLPALAMATELQVAGLFKKLPKEIDDTEEEAVLKYHFRVQDAGSTEMLYDRWAAQATDSEKFKRLCDGFAANTVRTLTLEKFYNYQKGKSADSARKAAARRILLAQIGRDPDDETLDFDRAWREFRVEDKDDNTTWPLEKDKVRIGWEDFYRAGRVRLCYMNYKLYPGASLELYRIPENLQDTTFYMKCWIKVLSGDGAKFAMQVGEKDPGALVKYGRWVLSTTGQPRPKSNVVPGAWEEMTLYYEHDPRTAEKYDRRCVVTVEKKLTHDAGALNGRFVKLIITAGEGSTLVVGGLHYKFQA